MFLANVSYERDDKVVKEGFCQILLDADNVEVALQKLTDFLCERASSEGVLDKLQKAYLDELLEIRDAPPEPAILEVKHRRAPRIPDLTCTLPDGGQDVVVAYLTHPIEEGVFDDEPIVDMTG